MSQTFKYTSLPTNTQQIITLQVFLIGYIYTYIAKYFLVNTHNNNTYLEVFIPRPRTNTKRYYSAC